MQQKFNEMQMVKDDMAAYKNGINSSVSMHHLTVSDV